MNTLIAFTDVKTRLELSERLAENGHSVRYVAELKDLLLVLGQATYGLIIVHRRLLGGSLERGIQTVKSHQARADLWIVTGNESDEIELTRLSIVKPDRTVKTSELFEKLILQGYIKPLPENVPETTKA